MGRSSCVYERCWCCPTSLHPLRRPSFFSQSLARNPHDEFESTSPKTLGLFYLKNGRSLLTGLPSTRNRQRTRTRQYTSKLSLWFEVSTLCCGTYLHGNCTASSALVHLCR
jgi:hypothetical protein